MPHLIYLICSLRKDGLPSLEKCNPKIFFTYEEANEFLNDEREYPDYLRKHYGIFSAVIEIQERAFTEMDISMYKEE